MIAYRRRPSPLHAARGSVGAAFCAALALPALLFDHPLVLAAVAVSVLATGAQAGVGRELRRALLPALLLAGLVLVVNPLVSRDGLTVIARLGSLPVLGRLDITLEATAYGAVQGLRALVLVLVAALYTLAVDPDEMLALFRRVSFRSALTASLATRLVPVLARDGARLADAQRCRPGPSVSRLALVRAVGASALDRAVDVAAALEVRGYGSARRFRRRSRPWSRHDIAFALAAATLVGLAVAGRLAGIAAFAPYPRLDAASDPATIGLAVILAALALAPGLDRRGIR